MIFHPTQKLKEIGINNKNLTRTIFLKLIIDYISHQLESSFKFT